MPNSMTRTQLHGHSARRARRHGIHAPQLALQVGIAVCAIGLAAQQTRYEAAQGL